MTPGETDLRVFFFIVAAVERGRLRLRAPPVRAPEGAEIPTPLTQDRDLPTAQAALVDTFPPDRRSGTRPESWQSAAIPSGSGFAAGFRWPSAVSIFVGIKMRHRRDARDSGASGRPSRFSGNPFQPVPWPFICGAGFGYLFPDSRTRTPRAPTCGPFAPRPSPPPSICWCSPSEAGQGLDAAILDTSRRRSAFRIPTWPPNSPSFSSN